MKNFNIGDSNTFSYQGNDVSLQTGDFCDVHLSGNNLRIVTGDSTTLYLKGNHITVTAGDYCSIHIEGLNNRIIMGDSCNLISSDELDQLDQGDYCHVDFLNFLRFEESEIQEESKVKMPVKSGPKLKASLSIDLLPSEEQKAIATSTESKEDAPHTNLFVDKMFSFFKKHFTENNMGMTMPPVMAPTKPYIKPAKIISLPATLPDTKKRNFHAGSLSSLRPLPVVTPTILLTPSIRKFGLLAARTSTLQMLLPPMIKAASMATKLK